MATVQRLQPVALDQVNIAAAFPTGVQRHTWNDAETRPCASHDSCVHAVHDVRERYHKNKLIDAYATRLHRYHTQSNKARSLSLLLLSADF